MKVFFQYLACGLTGVAIAAVLVAVGTLFFEGLSSSNIMTQLTLAVAGRMIILAMALAGFAWVIAYPH